MKAKTPIDPKRLEACIMLGASDADLAVMFDLSLRTLRRRYGETIAKLRAERRTQIRRLVWESAKESNPTLLTWLGKTELGWTEINTNGPTEPSPQRRLKPFDFEAFAAEFERLLATENREQADEPGERTAPADSTDESLHPADADAETGGIPRASGE